MARMKNNRCKLPSPLVAMEEYDSFSGSDELKGMPGAGCLLRQVKLHPR